MFFNLMIMKLSQFLPLTVFIVAAVLYCIFIVPICNHTVHAMWCFVAWLLAVAFLFAVGDKFITIPEKYSKYSGGALDAVGLVVALLICFFYEFYYEGVRIDNGPTLIAKYHITKVKSEKRRYVSCGYFKIGRQNYMDDYKYSLQSLSKPKGKWSYIMYLLDCEEPLHWYQKDPTENKIALIHDFAFMENGTLFTYHDYALKKPDLVYSYVGFYLVYKASCSRYSTSDSLVQLCYHDKNDKLWVLKYKMNRNDVFADTMLVYKNIADKQFNDYNFYVCLPELNTPENRAKINKYGYIFHHDIYSKEDIETQCPRIKEYVDAMRSWSGFADAVRQKR